MFVLAHLTWYLPIIISLGILNTMQTNILIDHFQRFFLVSLLF